MQRMHEIAVWKLIQACILTQNTKLKKQVHDIAYIVIIQGMIRCQWCTIHSIALRNFSRKRRDFRWKRVPCSDWAGKKNFGTAKSDTGLGYNGSVMYSSTRIVE